VNGLRAFFSPRRRGDAEEDAEFLLDLLEGIEVMEEAEVRETWSALARSRFT